MASFISVLQLVITSKHFATFPDINECASSNGGCAQVCTNSVGSFQCSCNSGYTLNVDGRTCSGKQGQSHHALNNVNMHSIVITYLHAISSKLDINECATSNGGCNQHCTNTPGSFQCSCNNGFSLSSNGRTCVDNDECTANTDDCSQICTNTAGSFSCSCNSGFTLATDGRTCVEINECTLGTHNCQQRCVNTQGGFRCECNSGFQLNSDQRTCSGEITHFPLCHTIS